MTKIQNPARPAGKAVLPAAMKPAVAVPPAYRPGNGPVRAGAPPGHGVQRVASRVATGAPPQKPQARQAPRPAAPPVFRPQPPTSPRYRPLPNPRHLLPKMVSRAWHHQAIQRSITVGVDNYSPGDLTQHLWDKSQNVDDGLVWHDEYVDAVDDFARENKVFNNEIDLIMGLAGATMARRRAIKEEVKDNPIAQSLYDGTEFLLASEFVKEYDDKSNPMISVALMVKLRAKGWLKVHADLYRESVGGQNGMIYTFQIKGFLARKPSLGEWHVHWESGNKAGSPGWKRGKKVKQPSSKQELEQLRVILGGIWGVVKSSGGGVWV